MTLSSVPTVKQQIPSSEVPLLLRNIQPPFSIFSSLGLTISHSVSGYCKAKPFLKDESNIHFETDVLGLDCLVLRL